MEKVMPPPTIMQGSSNNKTQYLPHVVAQEVSLSTDQNSLILSFGIESPINQQEVRESSLALSIPAANQLARSIRTEVKNYLNSQPSSE